MQNILDRVKEKVASHDNSHQQQQQQQPQKNPPQKKDPHPHHLPRPQPGGPIEPVTGQGPLESVQLLGEQLSANAELIRDLGFTGRIGNTYINSYGDVHICGDGSRADREKQNRPMITASNCGAFCTDDPLRVQDFNLTPGKRAQMFCPLLDDACEKPGHEYAIGITNVIPTSDTTGVVYFMKNWRKGGINRMAGAGVAVVELHGSQCTARRLSEFWWDANKEPAYGDHSACLAPDGFTYAFGGSYDGKGNPPFFRGLYVCRVPSGQETDLSRYEYWNGKAYTPQHIEPRKEHSILGEGSTGGMICWNPYLKKYLYIYTTFNVVIGRVADRPEGPWEPHWTIKGFADRAYVYCPSQQYQYDPSGKTLIVSFTASPNQIFVLKLVFK